MRETKLNRRQFLQVSGALLGGAALAACTPVAQPAGDAGSTAPGGKVVNSLGIELPADAAPLEQQVFRFAAIEGKHFDVARNEYEGFAYEHASEYLTRRDGDNVYRPAGADSWEVSDDGLTWTFHLRQNAQWSDGKPVTADDWVFSLQRYVDPKMANGYAWFLFNILNAEAVNKGEKPLEELGVKKIDDYSFSITTSTPIPYFLSIAGWHFIVPKHAVEQHGDAWADSPETAVSNGPFVIKEWNKGKNVIFGLNTQYTGPFKPMIEQMEMVIIPESGAPLVQMYEAGEIDTTGVGGEELAQMLADPAKKSEIFTETAFVSAYLFFNDTKPPFNDIKVRQAISHAIDRDAIKQVMQGLIEPAYGHLPMGFPCSQNADPEFRKIQGYDPEAAKKLLAEAGFADGAGFPQFELWTRQGQYVREAEAIQNMLKENLGIVVTIKDQERSFFMDKLRAYEIDFGLVQWGADYVDPTNFFDWWGNQSRHTWKNEEFNKLIDEARGLIDTEKRCQIYNDAEKILVSDVGAVFLLNPTTGSLFKSYLGNLPLNKQGVPGQMSQLGPVSVYIKQH